MSAIKKSDLPYKVDSEYNIINILKQRHEIPTYSRPFMWTRDNYIEYVVNQIIDDWSENKKCFMGFTILYTGDEVPAVADAQHRLTITFLIVLALSRLLGNDEALQWISCYGTNSVLSPVIPEEDQQILEEYEWTRFPNIHSCYVQDFQALGDLLNNSDMCDSASESKIPVAYQAIKETLAERVTEPRDITSLLSFIHNDVIVIRFTSNEWKFILQQFGALNGIKVAVPASYLLKNAFIKAIGFEHKNTVHSYFESLRLHFTNSHGYEHYINQITNLFHGKILSPDAYERQINTIVEAVAMPFERFKHIADVHDSIRKYIADDPYGKLLIKMTTGHEIWSLCLYPLGFVAFETGQQRAIHTIIHLLLSYCIREQRIVSFNRLAFQTPLIVICNEILSNSISLNDAIGQLKVLISRWLGDNKLRTKFSENMCLQYYNKRRFPVARCSLLYLVQKTDSHECRLDPDATHIDHIYPQKPGKSVAPLADPNSRHKIGNFTPFVGKNSGSVKGNSALGNKPFAAKVEHYKQSNIAMTRAVAANYESTGFADAQIEERTERIAEQLAQLTAADLGF